MEHRPYTLIAELTYRCPLSCPYCYNPVDYTRHTHELGTGVWLRVFEEAEALGVVQLHLTGGEPLARKDLEDLIRGARGLGLYTNLITSGVPLSRDRLRGLRDAGLDNVQLSIQDVEAGSSDRIAGYRAFSHKLEVAQWVKAEGLPLTLNMVLHRDNLDRVGETVTLAERLNADRLERRAVVLDPSRGELLQTGLRGLGHAPRHRGPGRVAVLPRRQRPLPARHVPRGGLGLRLRRRPGGRALPGRARDGRAGGSVCRARERHLEPAGAGLDHRLGAQPRGAERLLPRRLALVQHLPLRDP